MGKSSVARKPSPTPRRLTVLRVEDCADTSRRPDDHMVDAGAGWYYDPDDEAIYRYWDGDCWTEHRSDVFPSDKPE